MKFTQEFRPTSAIYVAFPFPLFCLANAIMTNCFVNWHALTKMWKGQHRKRFLPNCWSRSWLGTRSRHLFRNQNLYGFRLRVIDSPMNGRNAIAPSGYLFRKIHDVVHINEGNMIRCMGTVKVRWFKCTTSQFIIDIVRGTRVSRHLSVQFGTAEAHCSGPDSSLQFIQYHN